MPTGHPWPKEYRERAFAYLGKGVTPARVAKRLGIPQATIEVWRFNKRREIPMNQPMKWEIV